MASRAGARARHLGEPAGAPLAVFGCGLIGASAAAGWSAAGHEVWGADRRDLAPLVERGWIARQVPVEALAEAGAVLLALPVGGILGALRRVPFRAGQLVTDVGGVKAPVLGAARHLPVGVTFVGGHPLAGSAAGGYEAASPDLFRGARWALVGDEAGCAAVEPLLRDLGAESLRCAAEEHDRVVALTSHLPQLLATALAAELEARDEPLAAALLGPGGRDFLRLAASGWSVWRDVLEHNRGAVEQALEAVRGRAAAPPAALEEEFLAAQRFMRRLLQNST
jgi:prephenate dehydrogenase